jgi:hypothetical protein
MVIGYKVAGSMASSWSDAIEGGTTLTLDSVLVAGPIVSL